jgi:hypothetical protein
VTLIGGARKQALEKNVISVPARLLLATGTFGNASMNSATLVKLRGHREHTGASGLST